MKKDLLFDSNDSIVKYLKLCDHHYYDLDDPIISDEEYDKLKSKVGEYDYVPGHALFSKVKHTTPVTSLEKVQASDSENLIKHYHRLNDNSEEAGVFLEWKYDGLTIVKYPDGRCVTRGDGETGEDVTANCLKIPGIKEMHSDYPIRMEVMMTKSAFERINKERIKDNLEPYKNTRNAAAGMLRNLDSKKVKGLIAIAYELIGHKGTGYEMTKELFLAVDQNKECIARNVWIHSEQDLLTQIREHELEREHLDYDVDGLVLKTNRADSLTYYGSTNHHPLNAVAIKFETPIVWTKLKSIKWQVGRTGKVSPVAEFDPIDILGSTVERATLHNIAYIHALGLTHYAQDHSYCTEVAVTKANEIIPAVVDVRHPSNLDTYTYQVQEPTHCPDCNEPLEKVKDQVYCRNTSCKERLIGHAAHLCSKEGLDIKGISEETVRKIFDVLGGIHEYGFVFPLLVEKEDLLKIDGFAERSATKLYLAIQKARKDVKLSNFLSACGIPLVGKSKAKLIAKHFDSIHEVKEDLDAGAPILRSIPTIGDELITSLNKHWEDVLRLLLQIDNIISEKVEQTFKSSICKTFVITGTLEQPRSYYVSKIESAGHKVTGSVSKKTDYLVCADDSLTTSKAIKAKELNIPIISPESLEDIL